MTHFNQAAFNRFAIENNVVGFYEKPITLKSGRASHFYINWRNVTSDAYLTNYLANFMLDYVKEKNLQPDTFFGVPEGATKIGIIVQDRYAQRTQQNPAGHYGKGSHVLAMGRAFTKTHGVESDSRFLGKPRGKTLLIEDVATTGESLLHTLDDLRCAEVDVSGALCLTNRMEKNALGKSVEELLQERNVPLYAMSNAKEILPLAYHLYAPGKKVGLAIEKEFLTYGVQQVKLV